VKNIIKEGICENYDNIDLFQNHAVCFWEKLKSDEIGNVEKLQGVWITVKG